MAIKKSVIAQDQSVHYDVMLLPDTRTQSDGWERYGRTVYYVDATNGNDSNLGTSVTDAWQSHSKVRNSSFQPGDSILYKRGETLRSYLTFPSSGTAGSEIIISAYGSGAAPIFKGSKIRTVWTPEGTPNIWQAAASNEPQGVWFDETRGDEQANIPALVAEYDWFWAANVLYCFAATDPDTRYTSPGVESSYTAPLQLNGKSNIVVRDITIMHGDNSGLYMSNGCSNITIEDCTVSYNATTGIFSNDGTGPMDAGVTIRNCTTRYNGNAGIYAGRYTYGWLITNNDVRDNSLIGLYTAGIKCGGQIVGSGAHIIEYNHAANSPVDNAGIWVDLVLVGCIVRYNLVEDCASDGIFIEASDDCEVYYNICAGNQVGIDLRGQTVVGLDNTHVYNNVCYDNFYNIQVRGWDTADDCTNNLIRNNILFDAVGAELHCAEGGENDGVNGYGNVYENNCLGVEAVGFVIWGTGNPLDTYNAWEAAYGASTDSIETDPLMVNPGADDFHLQVGSPCRDAGVDVGLTPDYDGVSVPQESNPAIGALEYVA